MKTVVMRARVREDLKELFDRVAPNHGDKTDLLNEALEIVIERHVAKIERSIQIKQLLNDPKAS